MQVTWKKETDASVKSLVDSIQNINTSDSDRQKAFIVLTYRFREQVSQKCEVICKNYGHNAITAEMIAQRTFQAFFIKGGFIEEKGQGKTYEQSMLLYLFQIAHNELISYYREIERKKNNPYDDTEQIIWDIPERSLDGCSADTIIEYQIIRCLNKSKKAIYLTYRVYQKPGFMMPRKLLKNLRECLGVISQNTINCYLKEVRDQIKQAKELHQKTNEIQNGI